MKFRDSEMKLRCLLIVSCYFKKLANTQSFCLATSRIVFVCGLFKALVQMSGC